MRIVTFDDVRGLGISPVQCFKWVEEALKHKNEAFLPAKISIKPDIPGVFYNTMPSVLPWTGYAGVKLVTRYPDRTPALESQILLYSISDGRLLALMDGTWITTMRTGAVAAHSIELFAKRDYRTMGIIGLGNTAAATLSVLLARNPNRELSIKLLEYKDQHIRFAQRFEDYSNVRFSFVASPEDAVKGCDVVVSAATVLDRDVCADDCFDPGVVVVPIHTRGFTNCDLFFDKVYADDTAHVKGFKYFDRFRSFAEVFDVIEGSAHGRDSDEERILVYNIGISLHDIFFAGKVYESLNPGDGKNISFDPDLEKFWV